MRGDTVSQVHIFVEIGVAGPDSRSTYAALHLGNALHPPKSGVLGLPRVGVGVRVSVSWKKITSEKLLRSVDWPSGKTHLLFLHGTFQTLL